MAQSWKNVDGEMMVVGGKDVKEVPRSSPVNLTNFCNFLGCVIYRHARRHPLGVSP